MRTDDTSAGFSMVEMLAALAITALLMAMVPGTLRLGKRAWEAGQKGQETAALASLDFIAERLQGALPIFLSEPSGLTHVQFSGQPHSVRFVSELASGPRGGGLYTIAFGQDAPGNVTLRLDLLAAADARPAEVRELAPGLAAVSLRYYGAAQQGEGGQWHSRWTRDDRLPDLVEISPVLRARAPMSPITIDLRMRPL